MSSEIVVIHGKKFVLVKGELVTMDKRMMRVQDYIWELWNGKIPRGYRAYSLNGNKYDTSLCNLKLEPYEGDEYEYDGKNYVSSSTVCKCCQKPYIKTYKVAMYCSPRCRKMQYYKDGTCFNDIRSCLTCKKEFTCVRSEKTKYCSIECSKNHVRQKTCKFCEKTFETRFPHTKYCSLTCKRKEFRKNKKQDF